MCGITGIIHLDKKSVDASDLLSMNNVIAHRGPDDEGFVLIDTVENNYYLFSGPRSCGNIRTTMPSICQCEGNSRANIGLGHLRFSIIDLTEAAHQPLFSHDGSCCIVFNGEIFNYIELRKELTSLGVVFRTQSDTEVLMEAYRIWETDCFARFNGFWALAIYDFKYGKLILSRDRLGQKPLFWTRHGASIYFSSEIKSLFQINDVTIRRKVNEQAIYQWLIYGRKNINNTTCFDGIYSFPAGSWAIIDEYFPKKISRYWFVPGERLKERDVSVENAVIKLREVLEDAVQIRLRSDVPLCIQLSGGLDSSTLVALAAQNSPFKITTFTLRYREKKWNEEHYAKVVAKRFNLDYRIIDPSIEEFWNQISAFTYLQEEPYHSPSLKVAQDIGSGVRADGVKVCLSGGAGDELFAGYSSYFGAAQAENLLKGQYKQFCINLCSHTESKNILVASIKSMLQPFRSMPLLNRIRLLQYSNLLCFDQNYPNPCRAITLSQSLFSDITNTLMPYWLTSGDRTSMGIPVEGRAPFLDYRVVEFAFQLPATYLIRDGWHKWILRKTMENILPDEVLWRRNKLGMPFPYERFSTDNKMIINLILRRARNPYMDLSHQTSHNINWRYISFLLWYEMFFNNNYELFEDIEAISHTQQPRMADNYQSAYHSTIPLAKL